MKKKDLYQIARGLGDNFIDLSEFPELIKANLEKNKKSESLNTKSEDIIK